MRTILLFMASLLAGGAAPCAPIVGATVQIFFHSPGDQQLTLRITNASTKDITAYILSVHTVDANGTRRDFHTMYDFLANQLFLARYQGTGDEDYFRRQIGPTALTPGQNYDQVSSMPANTNDFAVLLTAVAYSDRTAEAISQEALEPLIEQRESEANAIARANEIISANPDPQAAIKKIKNLRDVFKASPHEKMEMSEHTLNEIIEDLGTKSDVKAYQATRERERAVWADQARLKLEGAS